MTKAWPRWTREHKVLVLGSAVVLLLAGSWLWLLGGALRLAEMPPIGGPFQLIASDGRTVSDRDLRGKYLLIYFGYTSCADICPTTLSDIVDALTRLGSRAERIQPIFITVDPQRDTPQLMARYVAGFAPNLLGLTGSLEEITAVEKEYHITATIVPGDHGSDVYTMDHGAAVYLVGPDGQFIAALRADQGGKAIATEVEQYLS